MADIFLSYAREDEARAKVLAAALEAEGWSVFWDRTIPPGKTWRKILDSELEQAGCIVVAWSRAANESHWVCEEEAAEGHERGILFPVLFETVRPPRGFRALQAADLVDWDGDTEAYEFRKLVRAIAAIRPPSRVAVVATIKSDQPARSHTNPSRRR